MPSDRSLIPNGCHWDPMSTRDDPQFNEETSIESLRMCMAVARTIPHRSIRPSSAKHSPCWNNDRLATAPST